MTAHAGPLSLPWYVVHAKPRQEKRAQENLERQGYAVYLPRIRILKRVRGRHQIQVEALFPRYLFVQPASGEHSIAPVRSTIGVASLVRFGHQPAAIWEKTLAAIRKFEAENHAASEIDISPFQPGRPIRIVDGPLRGLEGLVSEIGNERVMVLLHLLGQESKVSLGRDQLAVVH